MISIINPTDACNIQAEPKTRQIALTHLANERKLETSLRGKHGNTPHANGKIHDVFTCKTNDIMSPSPLCTQIKMTNTQGEVLYNALLDTRASHNLLSFNAWNQLGRPTLTQPDFKVKGVNGHTSYVLGIFSTLIHCANSHMQGSFCVMPAGELFENVLLGRTWMASTKCTIDWATNIVTMVTPSFPTCTHCTHYSLQKLTLSEGPLELASPKSNPKLTPNAFTTNPLHAPKLIPTHTTPTIWQPRHQMTFKCVPKQMPQ